MTPHPIAQRYREMTADEYAVLKADIAKNGVRMVVWMYEGKILDGRHRFKAAQELGKACPMQEFGGTDPHGFVRSVNEARRHLGTGARAMKAADEATAGVGNPEFSNSLKIDDREDEGEPEAVTPSAALAAARNSVSRATVAQAKKVKAKGSPALVEAVKSGEVSVSKAAEVVDEPPERQVAAAKASKPRLPTTDEGLRARVRELEAELARVTTEKDARIEELESRLETTSILLSDAVTANECFHADDPLKAALEKIKTIEAECAERIRIAEQSAHGQMNKANAAIRTLKAMQRKG